ncbi:MAG: hypothetical protein L0211_23940 [Planctomycetaceae bacterium]|nr:hypothetical protein [Planctomycetaceae bacterium]
MNPAYRACQLLGWSLVLLGIAANDSLGQPPPDTNGPAESAQLMRETGFSFSLSQKEDVGRLARVRYNGVLEATLALEKLARNEYNREDDEPHRAAQLLVFLGASEPRALAALCDNLLTLKGVDDEGGSPLSDFKAAQALVHIGGTRVRQAIFDSLRRPLDRRELLIRAHVLAKLDPPQIMCEHIKMAIAHQEELHRSKVFRDHDDQYLANLRQLHDWLKDAEFLKDRRNWP